MLNRFHVWFPGGKVIGSLLAYLLMDVADFYSMIYMFDKNLGKLREFLRSNELDDNTILIFLTDNGTYPRPAEVFNAGMRRTKGSVYEGGHRVPCFIYWPAASINKPVDINKLTMHADPCEKNDISADHINIVDELRDYYERYWESLSIVISPMNDP